MEEFNYKFYNLGDTKEKFKDYLRKSAIGINEIGGTGNVKIFVGENHFGPFLGEIFYDKSLIIYNFKDFIRGRFYDEEKKKELEKGFKSLEIIAKNWDSSEGKIKTEIQ